MKQIWCAESTHCFKDMTLHDTVEQEAERARLKTVIIVKSSLREFEVIR